MYGCCSKKLLHLAGVREKLFSKSFSLTPAPNVINLRNAGRYFLKKVPPRTPPQKLLYR